MPASPLSKTDLAGRVWRLMFDVLMQSAPERTRSLGRRGLTPNDARALSSLDLREGRTMRSLADAWECDPSNATWVVDRLEKLRLAERRNVPHDRRIKLVVLTPEGERTKAELLEEFYRAPANFTSLGRENLESLHRALTALAPLASTVSPTSRPQRSRKRKAR